MKVKYFLSALMASAVLTGHSVEASENETVFINAQGKLIIPHLILGNEIYYVQLNRTGAGYDFRLDANSVTKITPQPGADWASTAEVVGSWAPQGLPGVTLTFAVNGNYNLVTPAEDDCPAGTESGVWTFDEDTGVLFIRVLTDTNLDCGLSHPEGVTRVKREGANLRFLLVEEENGQPANVEFVLTPI